MGGSSPHCPDAAKKGKYNCEEAASCAAFKGSSGRMDLSSRGYPSKRLPVAAQNGAYMEGYAVNGHRNVMQLVLNTRSHGSKVSRRECGECFPVKGKVLAYRIFIAAVVVWLLFQTVLLLQGIVVKHSDSGEHVDNHGLAIRIPWNERLQRMSQSLMNNSVLLKQRTSSIEIQMNKNWLSLRSPRIALVCPHVGGGPDSLFLVTLVKGLQLLGYRFEVYAMKDGPSHSAWIDMGVPVNILGLDTTEIALVDWSRFEGVLAVSLQSRLFFSSLVQEPFKVIPVLWIIQDNKQVKHLEEAIGQPKSLLVSWKRAFERANAVVFPNDILLNACAQFDTGNFRIIPGSPLEVWDAEEYMTVNRRQITRAQYGLDANDFAIVVGSSNSNGIWKAHAMLMHAVAKRASKYLESEAYGQVKLFLLGHGSSHRNYDIALKAMAFQFGLNTSIHYIGDEHQNGIIWAADVVAYVSVAEERFFPPVLIRAMAFERVVVAPASQIIQNHIVDGVNGLLYPKEDYDMLCSHLLNVWQSRPFSLTSTGRLMARDLLAQEAVVGYGELLETKLEFPSEVSLPKPVSSIPKIVWEWKLFSSKSATSDDFHLNFEDSLKEDHSMSNDTSALAGSQEDEDYEGIAEDDVVEEKALHLLDEVERVEDEELEERKEQAQASFEDVNRGVKRAEREKFEFHERDDGELERTGQPLCIYEPYYGSGAWPFLHQNYPLYRGLSLSPKGRRPKFDDVDAASRLPLLNDTYYRDVLCEFGAFLAIANRIDRVHKNSWIGFQPWSAAGRKVALSQKAETSLLEAVRLGTHGDAVYFWAQVDGDISNITDFWSSCDARNAGSCRRIFLETFKQMYGLRDNSRELPPMPAGAWATMHSWAMPTSSFMEFVVFSRLFLDALDTELYVEHHDHGKCPLAGSRVEAQHCYCRLLDNLVNIWAYHSARKLIYVDPQTGTMKEQHSLESRRALMRVKWFSLSILKGMDEDMAEKADDEHPNHRWLWPHTGEVFWQGILERERQERYTMKMERKRRNKERLARMRSRYKQKSLGRYVKPPPDDVPLETEPVDTR